MRLKKLELIGFKSFSEKACIKFSPGISAVVGPNGCGKSNIADALRWVMGEQSAKQLRGKSMEDVIFAGTSGKLPLNMAEVSLTLLNDSGSAPEELKDFTEIMLTRRLYRSGESAYFMNKQPCRLKDIHNIFLGSGMGAKSYAVIEQGNIGAITEAGPEEKRFFIEEAAGVTRYKSRKNEALRKIQLTNQNLLRIADIIAEVKRQMDGLKRQAKKAELYNNYRDRIRKLDVFIAIHSYDDYTRRINETDALLKDLKDADFGHISRLKKLDAAVEEIKLQRLQKDREISEQKSRRFETRRSIDKMENDLAHFRKDVKRLAGETEELESVHEDIEEKNRNIVSEVTQIEKEHISLKEERKNAASSLNREQTVSQNTRDQLAELNQQIETCKTDLMDLVASEARYKNIYQNASNNKESLKRRLKRSDEEEGAANKKVALFGNDAKKAEEQLKSYKEEINDLDERINIMQKQLEEKSKALSEQVKHTQTLELERNKSKSKYIALKKMEDSFEWYKDGVRAIMKAHSSKIKTDESRKPADIIGLVADIIEPEPSFETAVEAVLGESLQYILVKDREAGIGYIDYLQTTGAGRSGFIPVSSVKCMEYSRHQTSNPQKKLLNHISAKEGFEEIVEALLGHVVVASSVKEAIEIYGGNSSLQTIVTKNGDIISCQGIMIGGSKDKLSGILAKKQELKELDHQITKLDQNLKSAGLYQKELESGLRIIESSMQKLIERKNKAAQKEIEAEKTLYKATEDLKHARHRLEIAELDQERLLGEESDIDEEIARYSKKLSEIESRVEAAQAMVMETKEKIGSVSSKLESFNQKIVDLKLKLTALNAGLENNNNTLRRLEEFRNDGIKRIKHLSIEIDQKNRKRLTFKQKITEYEHTLSGMYDDIKLLEQTLENNEADYQIINAGLKENDAIISKIQNSREKAVQKIRLLELEQSQKHLKLENIASRLEERYHKSLSEFRQEFDSMSEDSEMFSRMPTNEMKDVLSVLKKKIAGIGDVNSGAIKEYEQLKERFDFLSKQCDDLVKAIDDLHEVVKKINSITQERFIKTFNLINEKFDEVFPALFEGGSAKLVLIQPDKPLETGVELMIHPPGKKLTRLSLLSGGEKALSAIAFIFSIFLIRPASFCLIDEIDAPLDEANVFRFNNLLQIIGKKSQIVMITHNKKSMEFADMLFGITMEKKGISKIVSVNLARPEGI